MRTKPNCDIAIDMNLGNWKGPVPSRVEFCIFKFLLQYLISEFVIIADTLGVDPLNIFVDSKLSTVVDGIEIKGHW